MLNLQFELFALMLAGIVVRKLGILTPESRQKFTALFIDLILPANIIVSFHIRFSARIARSCGYILAIAFGVQLLSWLLSRFLFLKVPHGRQMVVRYGTICSNSGFMGNPVVQGIYGMEGLLYASIFLIPVRIFMWSAGLSLFTVTDRKSMVRKLLTHPCIIAVFIGLGLMGIGFRIPAFAMSTLTSLSNCTTAVAMILIGSILAEVDIRRVVDKLMLYYSFVRLVLIPLLVLGAMWLLHVPPLLTGVAVLLSGMPAGSTTAILAEQYGCDAEYASKCVLFTTVLSLGTLPLLGLLLNAVMR